MLQRHPLLVELDVGSLHRRPCGPVRDLFLPHVSRVRGNGMVEGFALDVLRVRREMTAHARGEVVV